jgi:hypothetical protein
MFGSPTLAQIEDPAYRPGGWRVARAEPQLTGQLSGPDTHP